MVCRKLHIILFSFCYKQKIPYLCIANINHTVIFSMKKTLLYLLVALTGILSAAAREIAPTEALHNALVALNGDAEADRILNDGERLRLMYTQKSGDNTLFYVFETAKGGFLIASANDNANPVLGYTGNGTFQEALSIPSFKAWVTDCRNALTFVANQPESAFREDYRRSMHRSHSARVNLPIIVSPLLGNIAWNQGAPYNNNCPLVMGSKCAAGCVATAMAMVMKYWQWPVHGTGEVSYVTSTYGIELNADFSQSTYEWTSMLNRYDGEYTEEQAAAVAKLLSDVGISVLMNYGPSSGAAAKRIPSALANNFFYNKGVKFLQRCYYSSEEWNDIIKGELAEKRPVLMTGTNYTELVGHEFVLDGYNTNGLYHVNWGWGGTSNGYFDVNFMSPDYQGIGGSNGGYVGDQTILVDLYPDKEGNSTYAYNLFAQRGLTFNSKKEFHLTLSNVGLEPFYGEAGIIVEKDGVIIASLMDSFSEDALQSMDDIILYYGLNELGLTASQIGEGKECHVYPAYKDESGKYVKLTVPNYESDYLVITSKDGALSVSNPTTGAAKLTQVSLTVDDRAFSGYPIYFKAQVKNEEGAAEFNNLIGVELVNSKGVRVGYGVDCQIIPGGSTKDFLIRVDASTLAIGSYKAYLVYGHLNDYDRIGTKYTTVVVNQAPAAAKLTYSTPTFFGARVEEAAPVDITMDVTNTGGYTEHEFAAYFFPNTSGDVNSVGVLGPVSCRITANKKNQIKISGIVDLQPGSYFCIVRDNTIGAWIPSNNVRHYFTVSESATGIKHISTENGMDASIYDLSGRKVNYQLSKGLYIRNGKKVIK